MTLIAALLLFFAIWIVVPAPNVWLLPLSVVVPELSPALLGLSVIVVLLSFRRKGVNKLAMLFALAAAGISAIPLSQLSATIRVFNREMAANLPAKRDTPVPNMRLAPFSVRDLFLGFETGNPRVMRGIQFSTPEGLPLVLDIYRPPTTGRFPMLLQIHGGAWQRGTKADDETFARYFANQGYVVISIEYRLAPRWQWPSQQQDVRAAIDWIRSHESTHEGDPARLALVGRSAGAQLALITAYYDNPGVHAVVSYYGPTNLVEGWSNPPNPDPLSVQSTLESFLGGPPKGVPHRYTEASPVSFASAASPPTLQIQGLRDHVVRPEFPRQLHEQLKKAGAHSVLLQLPWAEHGFDLIPQGMGGQLALFYTERFLASVLTPRR
jgi:acetyl esterase/lipase